MPTEHGSQESGQSVVEYGLIVGLVVIVVVTGFAVVSVNIMSAIVQIITAGVP